MANAGAVFREQIGVIGKTRTIMAVKVHRFTDCAARVENMSPCL